jgi:hypothetical protein
MEAADLFKAEEGLSRSPGSWPQPFIVQQGHLGPLGGFGILGSAALHIL